jgi:hypothetical protein
MNLVFTATLSDGSTVRATGTISFQAGSTVSGISAANISVAGMMPSGASVSSSTALQF